MKQIFNSVSEPCRSAFQKSETLVFFNFRGINANRGGLGGANKKMGGREVG